MRRWPASALLSVIAGFTIVSCVSFMKFTTTERNIASDSSQSSSKSLYLNEHFINDSNDRYLSRVQPIFNNRCIACHSCFNSPCQMNLTSFNGVDRGAIQDDIYDFRDIGNKTPTRLGIDVPQSLEWYVATQQWRDEIYVGSNGKSGFYPVVDRRSENPKSKLENSILYQLIRLKQENPHGLGKPFMAEKSRTCPLPPEKGLFGNHELEDYKANLPWAGMPYGFPQLSQEEMAEITEWIAQGSEPPRMHTFQKMQQPSKPDTIKKWESFFNGTDYRHRITARYIYEHLFLAHLYFEDMPGEFFRLIRAFCDEKGNNCYELATHRPTDDPRISPQYKKEAKGSIVYKLQKLTEALVHKSHIPYELTTAKLQKWNEMFINQISDRYKAFPSYGDEPGSNPFITFKEIPVKSRYQFLLDDSYFFVMSFIKGPVCRGSGALSVIDDHFWVFFLKPDSDVTIQHPEFYLEAGNKLAVPAYDGNKWKFLPQRRFGSRDIKKRYLNSYMTQGLDLKDIWDGDGFNQNAVLTIYRHDDSASVSKGAIGESPKTMWLLDYPIFEDIYYNLVGTYDVYAPIVHSVKSRLHMDASRFNSQDMFLGLLPKDLRNKVRIQFTHDGVLSEQSSSCKILSGELCAFYHQSADTMRDHVYPYAGPKIGSKIPVTDIENPQQEVAKKILEYLPTAVTSYTNEGINKRTDENREPVAKYLGRTDLTINDAENIFATFAGKKGIFGSELPELSYVQVIDRANSTVQWYSMIHNRERHNVAFFEEIAPEKDRLWQSKDSINIVKGFIGSYANAIFSVDIGRLPEFSNDILDLKSGRITINEFYKKFLVSRHNPNFWKYFDNMSYYAKQEGVTPQSDKFEGSVIDLNRYINDQGF